MLRAQRTATEEVALCRKYCTLAVLLNRANRDNGYVWYLARIMEIANGDNERRSALELPPIFRLQTIERSSTIVSLLDIAIRSNLHVPIFTYSYSFILWSYVAIGVLHCTLFDDTYSAHSRHLRFYSKISPFSTIITHSEGK